MTKIKICGLMCPADIEAVCKVRPDFAGSILTPGFRRSVAREQYREMNRIADRFVRGDARPHSAARR